MRDKTEYMVVEFSKAILLYGIVALSLIGLGLFSFITLEHEGHWLTGMNNQVVCLTDDLCVCIFPKQPNRRGTNKYSKWWLDFVLSSR